MAAMMEYLFRERDLDRIDTKILDAMRDNARISLKDLSKKCRVSKQTALYRINSLMEHRVIDGFHATIDYSKIGYLTYYVFIQTRYIENESTFISELSKIKGCIVIMKSITQYSYNLKLITKDIYSTMLELEAFFNKKKNVVSHFIVQRLEKNKDQIIIDDKDKAIIEELSVNCRLNSLELSRRINLKYDLVHAHVKNLIKNGVLDRFRTTINFESQGFMYYSIVLKFADDNLDKLPVFESLLKSDPLVVERFRCIGEFGYVFEIVDRDFVSINDKLNRIKSQFHEMIRYTQIVPIQKHYFYKTKLR